MGTYSAGERGAPHVRMEGFVLRQDLNRKGRKGIREVRKGVDLLLEVQLSDHRLQYLG
jgi:hypothetical protein